METKTGFDSRLTNNTAAVYEQEDEGERRAVTDKEVEE